MDVTGLLKKGLVVAATVLVIACGGGGGDAGPTYNGLTTQAVVDNSNSKHFSDSTYTGSGASGAFAALDAGGTDNGTNLQGFANTFRVFSKSFDVSKGSPGSTTAEVVNLNETIPGKCSGNFSFNINYDTETGVFDGSLTFNNLNDCDGTINGSVSYSGTIKLGDLSDFKMTFSSLTYSDSTESITMNGSAIFSQISSTVDQVVMNIDYRDNNTNVTYRTENLVITTTNNYSYTTETMTGKVYHPDYGYVDVTTESPIVVNYNDNYPSEGVIVMTGASGKATVTFNDKNSYTIEVDEGSDGSIDETKACTWEPDACV